MKKPLIAIPLGDPAGIGPEIVVKSLADRELRDEALTLVIGDLRVVEEALDFTGLSLKPYLVDSAAEVPDDPDTIPLLDLKNIAAADYTIGQVGARAGRAAYEFIEKSIELAMNREVDAVATTPINKESFHAANVPYIGHTEIFGDLTGTADPLTMFEVNHMRIFFLSRHVSLRQACDLVTKDRIKDYSVRIFDALEQLGVKSGLLGVAGLNPHCGEHGLFGDEEVNHVTPAVEELQAEGYDVVGPIGADSIFHLALQGNFASVLSLYHDQGHIASKTYDFERTISVTCGMPILRTSVDHGTAFDIAGRNIASAVSMVEAIRLAAEYAPNFVSSKN
ncbi:MAG TPA: 4-hydroxythreonine-4-phosphate dehydrogenase PdxA [Clostridiaceae bacterium]|nr:4-hydroxythreonine-4-phosphate dehydrogenase PdxA [Clostridiaceae bacterium]